MVTVGIVSPGHMGSGLGAALVRGGARVVATLAGRSARTHTLATEAGLELLASLNDVVAAADVVLMVTPPGAATVAASNVVDAADRTGARPLVADLNAISPSTMDGITNSVRAVGLDMVDGSISGPPPTVRPGARLYLSGPRAAEIAALPWADVRPIVLGEVIGAASALKMCTASVYKGLVALFARAMMTAEAHGVLEEVLADVQAAKYDFDPPTHVIRAATKAARYVPEMTEISRTQEAAGLDPELFEAMAATWTRIAISELAAHDPESVDLTLPPKEIVRRLQPRQ